MRQPVRTSAEDDSRPVSRRITAQLLQRYDRPGPRYTSYPTAVEFHDGFTADDYEQRLAQVAQRPEEPVSVYVHLPFCEERCLFCACNVIITRHKERARPYLDLLRREIDQVAERLGSRMRFAQLHLGGGTPTYFEPGELETLIRDLMEHFEPARDCEMAIEVDPRVTSRAHLESLAGLGFNRLSLGVQDLDAQVQRGINRIQTGEESAEIIDTARKLGYSGINVDLIYGLPHQTLERFERTVEWAIRQGVDRVAVYSFAHVPWLHPAQRRIDEEAMPCREDKLALFALARELFLGAGYEPIGMDHFARPEDELAHARRDGRLRRNFQGYTVLPATNTIGFGISAIGDVAGAFVQNEKKLSGYQRAITEARLPVARGFLRSQDDELRAAVIQQLMCNFGVDLPVLERQFGIRFGDYFGAELERLHAHVREGMVNVTPERIEVTPAGELFIRNLAMCFDRYWWEKHRDAEGPVFSRTV